MHYFTQNSSKFSGDGAQPPPQTLLYRHLRHLNSAPRLRLFVSTPRWLKPLPTEKSWECPWISRLCMGHDHSSHGIEDRDQRSRLGCQFETLTYIKYSLDLLRPITTAETFEAVNWLADLPQRTWPQAAGRSSDVILTSFY